MKYAIFLILILPYSNNCFGQKIPEGIYKGFEKICFSSTAKEHCINYVKSDKKTKWYHLNLLKIKGDSVFLDQLPLSVRKIDTIYSASDGGFYFWKGTYSFKNDILVIDLTEICCDYCAEILKIAEDGSGIKVRRKKQLEMIITNGIIKYGEDSYNFSDNNQSLISEDPPCLN